jgi:hypothetical protein
MASQRTRNRDAEKRSQEWDNGAAYELTDEEKEKVRIARLIWKKRGGNGKNRKAMAVGSVKKAG